MNEPILSDWSERKIADFGSLPLRLNHNLHRNSLFQEDALVQLIEKLTRDDYMVNTMDITAHNSASLREGEIRGLSGKAVLEAVKKGHIWLLLLHAQRLDSRYHDLLRELYGEFSRTLPFFRPYLLDSSILISSPNVLVYYHLDIPGQMLLQISGAKRVYIYPNREPFVNRAYLEKTLLGEEHECGLPYDPRFDEHAAVYDLQPGQLLHWPLNAPHRIINGNSVNISFATEHFTRSLRRQFFVNYANGVLRKRQGILRLSHTTSGPSYWAKLGIAVAYKMTGGQRRHKRVPNIDFAVDPAAPNGVRSITTPTFEAAGRRDEDTGWPRS